MQAKLPRTHVNMYPVTAFVQALPIGALGDAGRITILGYGEIAHRIYQEADPYDRVLLRLRPIPLPAPINTG